MQRYFPFFRFALSLASLAVGLNGLADAGLAQPPVHYFHRADLPPGTVGQGQLLRGGPLAGYFQPVQVDAPEGTLISLAVDGHFHPPATTQVRAGMLIGSVYRLKVGNIPNHPNAEIYPTIEVINRLYPPPGQTTRYPIPIELTQDELEMAIAGAFITRVIYLENPEFAFPVAQEESQRYFDVGERVDPLQVADELGRPMAILRMGSRVPAADSVTGQFLFETPPIMLWPTPHAGVPVGEAGAVSRAIDPADGATPEATPAPLPQSRRTVLEAFRGNIPRVPLPPSGFTSGENGPSTRR